MMTPAMYSLASSGPIHGVKTWRKKSQPRKAIEKGFTSQLTTSVTARPRGTPADAPDRREVDLEHHRVDHQPDEDGDRDVDVAPGAELHARASRRRARARASRSRPRAPCTPPPTGSGSARRRSSARASLIGLLSGPSGAPAPSGRRLIPRRRRSRSTRQSSSTGTRRSSRRMRRVRLDLRVAGDRLPDRLDRAPRPPRPRRAGGTTQRPSFRSSTHARALEVGEVRRDGRGGEVEHGGHLADAQLAARAAWPRCAGGRGARGPCRTSTVGARAGFAISLLPRSIVASGRVVNGSDDPVRPEGPMTSERSASSCSARATRAGRRWPRAGSTTCSATSGRPAPRAPRRPPASTRWPCARWPRSASTSPAGRPSTSASTSTSPGTWW